MKLLIASTIRISYNKVNFIYRWILCFYQYAHKVWSKSAHKKLFPIFSLDLGLGIVNKEYKDNRVTSLWATPYDKDKADNGISALCLVTCNVATSSPVC